MTHPNIVLIIGDNHGRGAVGCYEGGEDFETPHIDRLAAGGLRFTRYFCSNAYCSGARATLLTGLLPSQHGVHWVSFALGDTLDFYENEVVEDGARRTLSGRHVVDYFSEKAVERVRELRGAQPFFLSVWYDGPYALPPTNLGADPRNPYYERFAGKPFSTVPRVRVSEAVIRLLQLETCSGSTARGATPRASSRAPCTTI